MTPSDGAQSLQMYDATLSRDRQDWVAYTVIIALHVGSSVTQRKLQTPGNADVGSSVVRKLTGAVIPD